MPGRYFEELGVDEVFRHEVARTVTETDNLLFTVLSMNTQPLHLDEEFGKRSEFGTRIVNSTFTLATVVGMSVTDLTLGTTIANLGYERITFPSPVFIGDTLHTETQVMSKRQSKSRRDAGIVLFRHRGFNQRDQLVMECDRVALMKLREVI
jgi:acyl dehydratase